MTKDERLDWRVRQIGIVQTWWYGRPLSADDLLLVREALEAGRPTQGLFAGGPLDPVF